MRSLLTRFYRKTSKVGVLETVLFTAVVLLLAIVVTIPGVLRLMYRADAHVALNHAKSVRMALEVAAKEQYGKNAPLCDFTKTGGVTDDVLQEVVLLSEAPGDFWVLQTDNTGYVVKKFVYSDGDYTVWYDKDKKSYRVYHDTQYVDTEKIG